MICPAYDGSVTISWYPDMAVLKTTSPLVTPFAGVAPIASPSKVVPSASTSRAAWGFMSAILA
jgi:hypothetical protein